MTTIVDLPLELIGKITLSVDDPVNFGNLLLSNTVFRQSISEKELHQKGDPYEKPKFSYLGIPIFSQCKQNEPWDEDSPNPFNFNSLGGLVLNDMGKTIVCDNGNSCVKMFDYNGKFIKTVGSDGKEWVQFREPMTVAITPDGSIIVSLKNRILLSDKKGKFMSKLRNFHFFAVPITCNGSQLVVIDRAYNRIRIYGDFGRGKTLHAFGTKGTENGQIKWPKGICVDQYNNIIVADSSNHRVQMFDKEGIFTKTFGSRGKGDGKLNYPWGITANKRHNQIITTDYSNRCLSIWSNDGQFIRDISNLPNKPKYIAVSRSGRKAVVSFDNDTISCITL